MSSDGAGKSTVIVLLSIALVCGGGRGEYILGVAVKKSLNERNVTISISFNNRYRYYSRHNYSFIFKEIFTFISSSFWLNSHLHIHHMVTALI